MQTKSFSASPSLVLTKQNWCCMEEEGCLFLFLFLYEGRRRKISGSLSHEWGLPSLRICTLWLGTWVKTRVIGTQSCNEEEVVLLGWRRRRRFGRAGYERVGVEMEGADEEGSLIGSWGGKRQDCAVWPGESKRAVVFCLPGLCNTNILFWIKKREILSWREERLSPYYFLTEHPHLPPSVLVTPLSVPVWKSGHHTGGGCWGCGNSSHTPLY